jgi:hypothetical protein
MCVTVHTVHEAGARPEVGAVGWNPAFKSDPGPRLLTSPRPMDEPPPSPLASRGAARNAARPPDLTPPAEPPWD